jgi:hypothetical protein
MARTEEKFGHFHRRGPEQRCLYVKAHGGLNKAFYHDYVRASSERASAHGKWAALTAPSRRCLVVLAKRSTATLVTSGDMDGRLWRRGLGDAATTVSGNRT